MEFRVSRFFTNLGITVFSLIVCAMLVIPFLRYTDAEISPLWFLLYMAVLLMMGLLARSVYGSITFTDKNIEYRTDTFMQRCIYMNLSDVAEVGIGTSSSLFLQQRWIYFSSRSLPGYNTESLLFRWQSKDLMKLELTKETLAAVRKYYVGEIKYLPAEMEVQI